MSLQRFLVWRCCNGTTPRRTHPGPPPGLRPVRWNGRREERWQENWQIFKNATLNTPKSFHSLIKKKKRWRTSKVSALSSWLLCPVVHAQRKKNGFLFCIKHLLWTFEKNKNKKQSTVSCQIKVSKKISMGNASPLFSLCSSRRQWRELFPDVRFSPTDPYTQTHQNTWTWSCDAVFPPIACLLVYISTVTPFPRAGIT